jgi:hypothetical protein
METSADRSGPFRVVEHRFVELDIQEFAYPSQFTLRIPYQVFISHLRIRAGSNPSSGSAPAPHGRTPGYGTLDNAPASRQGDIPAVSDHVYEAGLGQQLMKEVDVSDIPRCFVAGTRFACLISVEQV